MSERRHYFAAGVAYPESDLFGYPDTLIRGRVDIAYKYPSTLLSGSNPERVLDIGSCHGHGVNTIQQIMRPRLIVSSDRWIDFLQAQQRVLKSTPEGTIDYVGLKIPSYLPFQDNSFNVTFLIHVLEHTKDADKLLEEMKRVTKPGGNLVIATPNRLNLVAHNHADEYVYTDDELKKEFDLLGLDTTIYYSVPSENAWRVHQRKKGLAKRFPFTKQLRKKIPWRIWDRLILRAGLTSDDFTFQPEPNPKAIDLLVMCTV